MKPYHQFLCSDSFGLKAFSSTEMSFVSGGIQPGSFPVAGSVGDVKASKDVHSSENLKEATDKSKSQDAKVEKNVAAEVKEAVRSGAQVCSGKTAVEKPSQSSPNTAANKGGSSIPGAKKGFGENDFACAECCVALASQELLDRHVSGQKHRQTVECQKQAEAQQDGHAGNSGSFCPPCSVDVPSQVQYDQHLDSQRHKTAAGGVQETAPTKAEISADFSDDFFDYGWNGMEQLPVQSTRQPVTKSTEAPKQSNPSTTAAAAAGGRHAVCPGGEAPANKSNGGSKGHRPSRANQQPRPAAPRSGHNQLWPPRSPPPWADGPAFGPDRRPPWAEEDRWLREREDRWHADEEWRRREEEEERRRYDEWRRHEAWRRDEERRYFEKRRYFEERQRYEEEQRWQHERRRHDDMDQYFRERTSRYYER